MQSGSGPGSNAMAGATNPTQPTTIKSACLPVRLSLLIEPLLCCYRVCESARLVPSVACPLSLIACPLSLVAASSGPFPHRALGVQTKLHQAGEHRKIAEAEIQRRRQPSHRHTPTLAPVAEQRAPVEHQLPAQHDRLP